MCVRIVGVLVLALTVCMSVGSSVLTAGPLSPDEARQAFVLHPGCRIELVASEPDVVDPVHIAFAPDGALWVVEYSDYPHGPKEGEPGLSRIRVLRDPDGDGRYSDPVTFADKLIFANGLMHWRDGVLVTTNGQVLFLRDTNGDGRSDETQQWFVGFETGNSQLRCNHPTLGPDGWIYIANGLRGGKVRPGQGYPWPMEEAAGPLDISGRDFRFDPASGRYEACSGNGQFGLTFNDSGDRFVCANRNPCNHIVLEEDQLQRAPYLRATRVFEEASPAAERSHVFPISRTWTTSNLHANTFTAACGVLIYRGDGLPEELSTHSFTCEPTGNLVHCDRLERTGITFHSRPERDGVEFLATRDEWFRPVNLAHGPDGALYVVDMYRAVIEHPEFVPDELKNRPDQMLGIDKGRIWRIVDREELIPAAELQTRRRGIGGATASAVELLKLLAHPNAWQRETGFRLLAERRDMTIVNALREAVQSPGKLCAQAQQDGLSRSSTTAALALSLLDIYGVLRIDDLQRRDLCVGTEEAVTALRLLGRRFRTHPRTKAIVAGWASRPPASDFEKPPAMSHEEWVRETLRIGRRHWGSVALLATDWETAGEFVDAEPAWLASIVQIGLGADPMRFFDQGIPLPPPAGSEQVDLSLIVEDLAAAVARKNDEAELVRLLSLALPQETTAPRVVAAIAAAVPGGRARVGALIAKLTPAEQTAFQQLLRRGIEAIQNVEASSAREQWIALLGLGDDKASLTALTTALTSGTDPQSARLVAAITQRPEPEIATTLATAAPRLDLAARNQALAALSTTPERIQKLLDLIQSGEVPAPSVDVGLAQRLRNHPAPEIRERAGLLLKVEPPADRQRVLAEYQACLALASDPVRGRQVFVRQCATCHKIGDTGIDVAPDISDSRVRTPEYLLTNIVDPNRAVDANFFSHTIRDRDGTTHTGVIASETATSVTLKLPEGKLISLARDQIEERRNNGVSLMPVGLEKNIPLQDMADLISFIKNWRYLDGSVPKEVIR